MPSRFEPGGIVQQEFFVGSTPVVAMKTGGLQDTVHNFDPLTKKGTGYVMNFHNRECLVEAVQKAIRVFRNESDYAKLRENSF